MNWRYLDHPTAQHCAFKLINENGPVGYYVLKIERQECWLMEFAAPAAPSDLASTMLLHLIDRARASGCDSIQFSAPPGWRHWKLFHAAGFLSGSSPIYMWPWPHDEEPERGRLTEWQWVPGDMDFL